MCYIYMCLVICMWLYVHMRISIYIVFQIYRSSSGVHICIHTGSFAAQEMNLWFLSAAILSAAIVLAQSEIITESNEGTLKSITFRYPTFTLGPGQVQNKFYYGIPFPKGHIAIREFNAEVIYEDWNPVPWSDVYLHHWVVMNYQKNVTNGFSLLGKDGVCPNKVLSQLYVGKTIWPGFRDTPHKHVFTKSIWCWSWSLWWWGMAPQSSCHRYTRYCRPIGVPEM